MLHARCVLSCNGLGGPEVYFDPVSVVGLDKDPATQCGISDSIVHAESTSDRVHVAL